MSICKKTTHAEQRQQKWGIIKVLPFILLTAVSSEDEGFLVDIYLRYQRLMYYIASCYVSTKEDQEEIVQTALLKIVNKVSVIRALDERSQAAYVGVLTKNTALNYLKHSAIISKYMADVTIEDLSNLPAENDPPEKTVIRMEKRERVRAVLKKLSESDQILIEGKYFLDLTDTEIANILGCKTRSITMMLTRARRHFLMEINREDPYDES